MKNVSHTVLPCTQYTRKTSDLFMCSTNSQLSEIQSRAGNCGHACIEHEHKSLLSLWQHGNVVCRSSPQRSPVSSLDTSAFQITLWYRYTLYFNLFLWKPSQVHFFFSALRGFLFPGRDFCCFSFVVEGCVCKFVLQVVANYLHKYHPIIPPML